MTDQDRFDKFLTKLPEEKVRILEADLIVDEGLTEGSYDMLRGYAVYKKNLTSQFANPKIQKQFINFNSFYDQFINLAMEKTQWQVDSRLQTYRMPKTQIKSFTEWVNKLYKEHRKFIKNALAILNKKEALDVQPQQSKPAFYFDKDSKALFIDNKEIPVGGKLQYAFLTLLNTQIGKVFSYNDISLAVYKIPIVGQSSINDSIDRLAIAIEKKLAKNGIKKEIFIRRTGYGLKK